MADPELTSAPMPAPPGDRWRHPLSSADDPPALPPRPRPREPMIRAQRLTDRQRRMVWRHVKDAHPALADAMRSDLVRRLTDELDARWSFGERLVRAACAEDDAA